jgi:hypothetical protein
MANIDINQHFANEQDEVTKNNELFSQTDLDEFTTLVDKQEDFDILLQWLKAKDILTEINKHKKLENTINDNIKKNKDQIAIFTGEYATLTSEQQNLYEICVLWAILKNEKDQVQNPDYKVLAKAYYEKINPTQGDKTQEAVDASLKIRETMIEDIRKNFDWKEIKNNMKDADTNIKTVLKFFSLADNPIIEQTFINAPAWNYFEKSSSLCTWNTNNNTREITKWTPWIDWIQLGNYDIKDVIGILQKNTDGSYSIENMKANGENTVIETPPAKVEKTDPDGTYVWDLVNGKREWTGKYTRKDGGTYEWQWKNNEIEWTGKFTRTDGETYEWSRKNGKREWTGKYIRKSGNSYEWTWKDDKKEWEGIFTKKDGTKSKQIREKDELKKETSLDGKIENTNSTISWTYEPAKADMKDDTITTIKNITTIEKWKNITEATVNVSAGADARIMEETKAKTLYNEKINALEERAQKFTNPDNKKQITDIIAELKKSENIDKISKEKNNQVGNRYLIAARIAEGFVEALDKLTLHPEPKLTLKIDWEKCIIGKSGKIEDIEWDRNISMNLSLKVETSSVIQTNTGSSTNQAETTAIETTNTGNTGSSTNQAETTAIETTNTVITTAVDVAEEEIEAMPEKIDSPDIFIAERMRISLSKDFKWNGKSIDKDKDIKKIKKTAHPDQFLVTIEDKDLLFSFNKIDIDWNFEKDTEGNLKIKEADKKYYEAKLETTATTEKFKVYDIKENNKNITATINEEKTKEAFKTYYTIQDKGYTIDTKDITITKSTDGDLENIKTNIRFTIPKSILDNQDAKPPTTQDVIADVIFDKNGEIKWWSGNTYEKFVGKNSFLLVSQEKDGNDNYKKEKKNLNYHIKISGKNISIINDEIIINQVSKIADWNDNRMASQIENANKTQETFKEYTVDLNTNFKKRQINAKGADQYELLAIPHITWVNESEYVKIPFTYKQKTNSQTSYFTFDEKSLKIPEIYSDKNNPKYFVIDNLYYKIDIPTWEQPSINPRIVLDYEKIKTEALKKTNIPNDNQIKAAPEKTDNNAGWRQERNIWLLNNITYNPAIYNDFSIKETERSITYTREISLDEVLWYDFKNKNKLVLGTIKFDGKGEIIETEDRNLKINKKNQTLEIKNIFWWKKTLTIPFEIKNNKFVIGTNSNDKAKYIVEEFNTQKEQLKNRIYDEKAVITTKLNNKIKEIWTQRASEFPWLKLETPKDGKRKESNTPTIDAYQYLKWPTSTGLYYLELNNAYKEGNDSRDGEFLYFKVTGKEVTLTDMNGNEINETYIQSNKQYKPGKWLVQIKNDLTITTIKDVEEQKNWYPEFVDEPETLKTYPTKTIDDARPENYEKEIFGKYMRIFGNSKIGHIVSIPIKSEDDNPNKYIYNPDGLKETTNEDMAKDLRDFDRVKVQGENVGLKESELKEIFMTKFKENKDIDKATEGNNIRIKNNNGKNEYWKISSTNGETIKFEDNKTAKEIQEKVVDDMKKDLAIIGSIENIKFKYRRSDERRKTTTDRDKAGNWTIKDINKETITNFIKTEAEEEKKIVLELLGPADETITLDINDNVYKKLKSKDLENGYYKDLFESTLDAGDDKEVAVNNESYKIHLESDINSKENRIIFESQVEKAQ